MAHEVIEIDSDSDGGVVVTGKGKSTAVFVGDGSDIAWDTLDDGWVDRIMKEGRESAQNGNSAIVDLCLSPRLPLIAPLPPTTKQNARTQSSQISAFTSPVKARPSTAIVVLDIADSPDAPRTTYVRSQATSVQPNGLLATGVRSILGGGVVDSDSDSGDEPLSLAFLKAPKVDKGKRRADLSEGVNDRTLKRSRTTTDESLLSQLPPRAALTASRSLSVLSENTSTRPTAGGMTAAEKRALKAIETERAKAEKAREKLRVNEERAQKKRDQEVNKLRNSKSDTVREVTIHISAELAVAPSPIATSIPLLRERLADKESSLTLVPVPTDDRPAPYDPVDGETTHVPGLITVKRWVNAEFNAATRRFVALPEGQEYWQDQLPYVLVVTAKEIVAKIVAGRTDKSRGLIAWLTSIKRKLGLTRSATVPAATTSIGAAPTTTPGSAQTNRCEIMLLIHGMKAWHSKAASVKRKEFSERARNHMAGYGVDADVEGESSSGGAPDKEEVDKELVRLQLVHRCFQVCVENKNDTMEWLYNIAGDIAIRPYRQVRNLETAWLPLMTLSHRHIQNSHLPFSTRDMPKKGDGPLNTFRLMLEEVTGVTESGAEGIVAQFKSFRSLMEGFERLERRKARGEILQKDVEGMLAGCTVKALTTGVANPRPIGTAVSKHVYKAFRGKDPDSIDN